MDNALISKAKQGCNRSFIEVLRINRKSINYFANRYTTDAMFDRDDIKQMCNIGILTAIQKFDEKRNGNFEKHAFNHMKSTLRNNIISYRSAQKRYGKTISIHKEIHDDLVFEDVLGKSFDVLMDKAISQYMKILNKKLKTKEKEILYYIMNDYSHKEIALNMNCSVSLVSQLIRKVRNKFTKVLEDEKKVLKNI